MVLNLAHPVADILETLSLGPFVVSLSNRSEPFLAGCVPYLHFHVFTIEVDRSDLKVDSYTNTKVSGFGTQPEEGECTYRW